MNDTTYAHKTRVEALRVLVLEYGSQARFARKFGLDASYISQILSGHRAFGEKAARNMEKKLAIPFGALDGHLIDNEVKGSNFEPAYVPQTTRSAPVISWVQAGEWADAVDLYSVGEGESREETPANAGPHAFWLRVKGDSMTAPAGLSVPEGYLIMVDPDTPPENGSLVVAKLDSEGEATFKKLVIDGPNRYLKPLNTTYDTIKINGNCRIVGTVKEIRFRP